MVTDPKCDPPFCGSEQCHNQAPIIGGFWKDFENLICVVDSPARDGMFSGSESRVGRGRVVAPDAGQDHSRYKIF
jgi:hypothetical protein